MEDLILSTKDGYFVSALIAGGVAGTVVDVSLFPLDTIKTRLQSAEGFRKAGGFRGIYSGLGSAALGSAPTASLFFFTYEGVKHAGSQFSDTSWSPVIHSTAASLAEVSACLIRVPVEVVKQRAQTQHTSSLQCLRHALHTEGFWGLYRGYMSTVLREIPFSFVQFPIWEYLKSVWSKHQGQPVDAWQSAVCGATAGGIAASVTTPLDVAKTRIMLAPRGSAISKGRIFQAIQVVHAERGIQGLFSGVVPRTLWISIGGAVFLGIYDKVRSTVIQCYHSNKDDAMNR